MSVHVLATYFVTWLIIVLTPGPAVFCLIGQSTRYGFSASLRGLAGLQTVSILFFLCIALGLGAILTAAHTAFTVIRCAGALYLMYLGGKHIYFSFKKTAPAALSEKPAENISANHRSLYFQGVLVQITNPKALLFMGAFLPQFIDPEHFLLQLGILLLPTIILDSIVQAAYAYLAHHGARSLRKTKLSAWLDRALGGILIFIGCRLLLNDKL